MLGALAGAALGPDGVSVRSGWGRSGAAVLAVRVRGLARRQRPDESQALPHRILAMRRSRRRWLGGRGADRGARRRGWRYSGVAGGLGVRPQKAALGPAVGLALFGGRRPHPAPCRSCRRRRLSGRIGRPVPRRPGEPAGRATPGPRTCRSWCRSRPARATSAPATSRELAELLGGDYARDAADVGIVAALDDLAGPTFDPALRCDPRVREFYEHTTRFALDIVPGGATWVRPGYLLYRTLVARPLGQANVPMNQRRGRQARHPSAGSTPIDREPGGDTVSVRGWIRSLRRAISDEADLLRRVSTPPTGAASAGTRVWGHASAAAGANFTATLAPRRPRRGGGLTLTSQGGSACRRRALPQQLVDPDTGELTTLAVPGFGEEPQVWARRWRGPVPTTRSRCSGCRSWCCATASAASPDHAAAPSTMIIIHLLCRWGSAKG